MLLKLKTDISEIVRVCDEVQKFCISHDITESSYNDLIFMLDELLTNVINYAYSDGQTHIFSLQLEHGNSRVTAVIEDGGCPFNPVIHGNPDVESSLEDRQIGGLGIFLVKQISEKIEYQRINEKNVLTIVLVVSYNGGNHGINN